MQYELYFFQADSSETGAEIIEQFTSGTMIPLPDGSAVRDSRADITLDGIRFCALLCAGDREQWSDAVSLFCAVSGIEWGTVTGNTLLLSNGRSREISVTAFQNVSLQK